MDTVEEKKEGEKKHTWVLTVCGSHLPTWWRSHSDMPNNVAVSQEDLWRRHGEHKMERGGGTSSKRVAYVEEKLKKKKKT